MSIDFSNEQEQTFDFDFLKVAEDVMETVLDQEGCPYESQVCLVLTDNETIHKTNLEYRQIDRATDVLSFPMVDFPAPADYSVLEDDDSCFDPESGELLLGDIMISIPKAVEQAQNIFVLVASSTWTSSPIMVSYCFMLPCLLLLVFRNLLLLFHKRGLRGESFSP